MVYTAMALILPGIAMFAAIGRIDRAHSELRAALHAAHAANMAKSRFLANMSHELRTPLNAVIGFSDVMGGEMFGPLLPRYREYTTDIRKAGLHLLNIINDVLDISKAEAAEFRVHLSDTSLSAIFAEVEMLAAGLATQAGVGLRFELPAAPVLVRADRVRLTQSLLNLVSNGIKFNKTGGQVTVRAWVQGGQVHIEVQDTGIGMAPDEIADAFQPFVQLNTGFARRFEGTGLGLPLTRMLVEAMKGSLQVESEAGVGTRITMRLPAAAAPQIANAA
jgi:two-component system cell cycle sensor histidine kinase PleC